MPLIWIIWFIVFNTFNVIFWFVSSALIFALICFTCFLVPTFICLIFKLFCIIQSPFYFLLLFFLVDALNIHSPFSLCFKFVLVPVPRCCMDFRTLKNYLSFHLYAIAIQCGCISFHCCFMHPIFIFIYCLLWMFLNPLLLSSLHLIKFSFCLKSTR